MIRLENGYDQCLHGELIDDHGVLICRICGLVINENNLIVHAERTYDHEQFKIRTHFATSKDKFASQRTIFLPKDAKADAKDVGKFIRMHRVDGWHTERSNKRSIEIKNKIKGYLEFSKMSGNREILKKMNYVLQKVSDYSMRGRSLDAISAAIIIYVLRTTKIPCNVKRLITFYDIKKKMSVFNILNDLIEKYDLPKMEEVRLRDYIGWYLYELDMNNLMRPEDVILLLNNGIYYADLMEGHSAGRSKLCDVAGILHFMFKANKISISQEEIAKCIGITSVSLRRAVKDLKELISLEEQEI